MERKLERFRFSSNRGCGLERFMFRWKQFCFSDGEAIRQEGAECAMRGIVRDGRHSGRPPAGSLSGRVNSGRILRPSDLAVHWVRPRRSPRPRSEFPPAERFHL